MENIQQEQTPIERLDEFVKRVTAFNDLVKIYLDGIESLVDNDDPENVPVRTIQTELPTRTALSIIHANIKYLTDDSVDVLEVAFMDKSEIHEMAEEIVSYFKSKNVHGILERITPTPTNPTN